MGAAAAAHGVGSDGAELMEALAVSPDGVSSPLRPLLKIGLEDFCSFYHQLACTDGDDVKVKDLAPSLGLGSSGVGLVSRGRRAVPKQEILVLLALTSLSHAMTKARVIFSLFENEGDGCLDFASFLAINSALLRACALLGRAREVRQAVVEAVAHSLFRPYFPRLTKIAFLSLISAQSNASQLLRRFARSASERHFHLDPYQQLAKAAHEKKMAATDRDKETMASRLPGPAGCASVRPAADVNEELPLPTRKGYFLGVRSARETELHQEMEQVRSQKIPGSDIIFELEKREEEIRKELEQEVINEQSRRDYRYKLQRFRAAGKFDFAKPPSQLRGHLWTASRDHVARGGVLPVGVTRPVSPMEVQLAVDAMEQPSSCDLEAKLKLSEFHQRTSRPQSARESQNRALRHAISRPQSARESQNRALRQPINRPQSAQESQNRALRQPINRPQSARESQNRALRQPINRPQSARESQNRAPRQPMGRPQSARESPKRAPRQPVGRPQSAPDSQNRVLRHLMSRPQSAQGAQHEAARVDKHIGTDSNDAEMASRASKFEGSVNHHMHKGFSAGLKQADVLLAFELYRTDYWRSAGRGVVTLHEAGMPPIPNPKETHAQAGARKIIEIDLILQEAWEDIEATNHGSPKSSADDHMSLAAFWKSIWPRVAKSDILVMLRWVSQAHNRPASRGYCEKSVEADPATLGELAHC
eukprot:TRINITY_DN3906_c0_g1_i1.p1 TRINITY_DN3906_c0_g1~~TRINITY_DN3906_c0_g1_i1.p1  ORF type:complete len:706 (-),score=88.23 TRINITY_DN3906_c0_g1_i1:405-2522(-)